MADDEMDSDIILSREPEKLAGEKFDIIVVGGGIYGACVLLEASRRGLKTLLVERDDFGGATSWNSLRIIHGGLRYLQTADLGRFHRSVAEQSWWLQHFPDIVEPMSCLMPLYDKGLRRRSVLGWALRLNDLLAKRIRRRYGDSVVDAMPAGKIVSAEETIERFALVDRDGLKGGAIWFDAKMNSPQRLQMEVLRWAASMGGSVLNYMNCTELLRSGDQVVGIETKCTESNVAFEFRGDYVVNCAGPWANELSSDSSHRDFAIAFNLLLEHPPLSADALALTPKNGKSTYFFVPHRDQLTVGTVHLPPNDTGKPDTTDLTHCLKELNNCTQEMTVNREDIRQLWAGRLPPISNGSHLPKKSPKIGSATDSPGLISVEGVKYTTARFVAERALKKISERQGRNLPPYVPSHRPPPNVRVAKELAVHDLHKLIRTECVMHLDDLLLRRIDVPESFENVLKRGKEVMSSLNWDETRQESEMLRLRNTLSNLST